LPSITLGKAFAECNRGFAKCPRHSVKPLNPVVIWSDENYKLVLTLLNFQGGVLNHHYNYIIWHTKVSNYVDSLCWISPIYIKRLSCKTSSTSSGKLVQFSCHYLLHVICMLYVRTTYMLRL
jgi:hypothetical protein